MGSRVIKSSPNVNYSTDLVYFSFMCISSVWQLFAMFLLYVVGLLKKFLTIITYLNILSYFDNAEWYYEIPCMTCEQNFQGLVIEVARRSSSRSKISWEVF